MELRLQDFFESEDVFVMGVSDSAPALPNRHNLGLVVSRRIREAEKCQVG